MRATVKTQIVFEKGVPLPQNVGPKRDLSKWNIGDSFVVATEPESTSVRNAARRQGFKVAIRKTDPVGWRCWRIA